MRVKSYGLMFDYIPAIETNKDKTDVTRDFVIQEINNFVLVNYFKGERKNIATYENGFQNLEKQMFIEMYMLTDTNPRRILWDKKDDSLYRILDTPIGQEFEPSKRKLIRLPIELIVDNDLRFNKDFIRQKFDELWRVLNAPL